MHDLTVLLDPINPDQPGGMSLLYEGIHQEIMEARREDDPNPVSYTHLTLPTTPYV